MIESLAMVCEFLRQNNGRRSDCISMLSLSDSDTRLKSNASERELESAVEVLKRGYNTNVSTYRRKDIVKDAGDRGIDYSKDNLKEYRFLHEMIGSVTANREFFQDIIRKYEYENNSSSCRGRCGYDIASDGYNAYFEEKVFGREASTFKGSGGRYDYKENIKKSLKEIGEQIEDDVTSIWNIETVFLSKNNKEKVMGAVDELKKCEISISNKVEANIKNMYTNIEYNDFKARIIDSLIGRYTKPQSGVVGYGASIGLGVGVYISGQGHFVIDSKGNAGILQTFGAGGGLGAEVYLDDFKFPTMDSIFDLESKSITDLFPSTSVTLGPVQLEGDFRNYESNISLGVGGVGIDGMSKIQNPKGKFGISFNGMVNHASLSSYKKVTR